MAQEVIGVASPDTQSREAGFISSRLLMKVGAVAGALAAVGGLSAFAANSLGSSGPADKRTAIQNVNIDLNDCNNLSFDVVNINTASPSNEAVLPSADMSSDQATQAIESGWFSKGPLGTTVDKGILAAVEAVTAKPANQGNNNQPVATSAQYKVWFSNALSSIENGGASQACKDVATVLNQDSEYGTFASSLANVTKVVPIRDASGEISAIDLQPYQVPVNQSITGLVVEKGDASKGEADYPAVGITSNGEIYLKGVAPTPKQGGETPSTTTTTLPEGTTSQNNNNNAGGAGNGNTSGSQGSGRNGTTGGGNTPEGAPGGSEQTPATGGAGGGTGGGGGGGGTPGTTPGTTTPGTTTPPETTPPTTAPAPTTTTTTPPSPPTTKGPVPCDPNVAQC